MNYFALAQNGRLNMESRFARENFSKFLLKHDGCRIAFMPVIPESKKQRKFFEGAYIPLWIYLDGHDHRDSELHDDYRELAKAEFNAGGMVVNGEVKKFGKSTKGKEALQKTMNNMLDYLVENYAIDPMEVLNPDDYFDWRNRIFPFGGPDNYIDYLVSIKKLKRHG